MVIILLDVGSILLQLLVQLIKLKICDFLYSGYVFYSCSNDPQLITEFITTEDLPIEQMENVEILHTEKEFYKLKLLLII